MNRENKPVQEKKVAPKKESNTMVASRKYIKYVNVFGTYTKDAVMNVMPYIFFLMFVALTYIANSYYAEKTIRDIDKVSKDLKTLRSEYITGKSELMFVSKQSEVAKAVAWQGIKESVEAPGKIIVDPEIEKN